jgi:hypothetical protein
MQTAPTTWLPSDEEDTLRYNNDDVEFASESKEVSELVLMGSSKLDIYAFIPTGTNLPLAASSTSQREMRLMIDDE